MNELSLQQAVFGFDAITEALADKECKDIILMGTSDTILESFNHVLSNAENENEFPKQNWTLDLTKGYKKAKIGRAVSLDNLENIFKALSYVCAKKGDEIPGMTSFAKFAKPFFDSSSSAGGFGSPSFVATDARAIVAIPATGRNGPSEQDAAQAGFSVFNCGWKNTFPAFTDDESILGKTMFKLPVDVSSKSKFMATLELACKLRKLYETKRTEKHPSLDADSAPVAYMGVAIGNQVFQAKILFKLFKSMFKLGCPKIELWQGKKIDPLYVVGHARDGRLVIGACMGIANPQSTDRKPVLRECDAVIVLY